MWALNSTIALLLSSFSSPKILVETSYGLLEGTSSQSRNERTVYEFLGVPYAEPPIGDLRFRAPVPPDSWEGIRDAKSTRPACLQIHLISRIIFGEEDHCLTLNIYTHQYVKYGTENLTIEADDLKPVIFYIHGGFFMHGSGNIYKGKYFLDEDVVLVTVNYRVGALGFLNMGNEEASGNMGLKDQVMALTWVQDNIKYFGGDPNMVTIMGESAGAVCVNLHMMSPMSKGLFKRAISQSGTALTYWAIKNSPQKQANRLAKKVGCDMGTLRETISCLKNLTGVQIVKGHRDASDLLADPLSIFGPTVEVVDSPLTFLNDTPFNIMKSGKMHYQGPWMAGANSEEGLIYAAPMLKNNTIRKAMNKNWSKWLPMIFNFDNEPNKKWIANSIREFYLGNGTAEISMKNLDNFTKFLSDRTFFEGLHNSALLHGQYSDSPLYLFLYAYKGRFSFARVAFQMTYFVPAIADIAVTSGWGWIKRNVFRMTPKDYACATGMNFRWKPFEESWLPANASEETISKDGNDVAFKFMRLDRDNKSRIMIDEPFGSRAHFWKNLNLEPCKVVKNATILHGNVSNDSSLVSINELYK